MRKREYYEKNIESFIIVFFVFLSYTCHLHFPLASGGQKI